MWKLNLTSHWEISLSCIIKESYNFTEQHLFIQFLLYYLVSGHLGEDNKKENFEIKLYKWSQLLMRGGHLQEVPNIVIWPGNFWYFRETGCWGEVPGPLKEVVEITRLTVVVYS